MDERPEKVTRTHHQGTTGIHDSMVIHFDRPDFLTNPPEGAYFRLPDGSVVIDTREDQTEGDPE